VIARHQVRRWLAMAFAGIGAIAVLACLVSAVARFTVRVGNGSVSLGSGAIAWRWASGPYTQNGQPVPPFPLIFQESIRWWWVPRWFGSPQDGEAILPLWIPIALGAAALYRMLPAGPLPGRCPRCRFDITGAPGVEVERVQVRCPECGTISALERAKGAGPAASAPVQSH
jgi:hypothetical protein